jgi:hypothetical protein
MTDQTKTTIIQRINQRPSLYCFRRSPDLVLPMKVALEVTGGSPIMRLQEGPTCKRTDPVAIGGTRFD